jgi:hypothetical protein
MGVEISDTGNITLDNLTISNEKGPFTKISYCDSISVSNVEIVGTDEDKVPIRIKDSRNVNLEKVKTELKGCLVSISEESKNIKTDYSIPESKIKTK